MKTRMKKLCSMLLALCLLMQPVVNAFAAQPAGSGEVVDVLEYGADPTGSRDSTEAIWAALQAAKEKSADGTKHVTLNFPTGEYHIYKDKAQTRPYHTSNTNSIEHPIKTIGLLIEDQKNLTLEGNGSLFMMHGNMMALAVAHSEDVELKNFAWDFAVPTVSEMTVLQVGQQNGHNFVDYYIPACFPYEVEGNTIRWNSEPSPYTGELYWTATGLHNSYGITVYQPEHEMTRIYGTGASPFGGVSGIEELSEGVVRFNYSGAAPEIAKPGYVIQLTGNTTRETAGAFTWESKNVTADHVKVHFMHGFGWLVQMSENVYYRNCDMMPREGSGHITASFADGIHASGAKGDFVIENCNFSHTHDDPINMHGTFTRVEQRRDDHTLQLNYVHAQQGGFPQYHVGDKVQFFTRDTLESTDNEAEYTVKRVISDPGEDGNDLRTMVVEFREPLPENLSDRIGGQPKYVAENVTYAPSVTIRGCTFQNVATRSILCTTRNKVIIEDNLFYPSSMAAIFLSNDSNDWYESGPIRDMTIRNNVFYVDDIGGRTSWPCAPAIWVHPVTKGGGLPDASNPIHKNITVEGNTFYMDEDMVVKAESVENFRFLNNKILRMTPDLSIQLEEVPALKAGKTATLTVHTSGQSNTRNIDNLFEFRQSKDVTIRGNHYDDGMKNYVIAEDDATAATLTNDDSAVVQLVRDRNHPASAPVGQLRFASSAPEVAYVDQNGQLVAKQAGTADIMAYYEWDDTLIRSNSVRVTVEGEGEAPAPEEPQVLSSSFSITREDPSQYSLSPEGITVTTDRGDLYGSNNSVKNLFLYDPAGVDKNNLRTVVKVSGLPVKEDGQWDTASFALYKDDDNYITIGKKSHFTGFSSVVEQKSSAVEEGGDARYNGTTEAWLGMTVQNGKVSLDYKVGEESWQHLRDVTTHTIGTDYRIGMACWHTNDRNKQVTFSDFHVGPADRSYDALLAEQHISFTGDREDTLDLYSITVNGQNIYTRGGEQEMQVNVPVECGTLAVQYAAVNPTLGTTELRINDIPVVGLAENRAAAALPVQDGDVVTVLRGGQTYRITVKTVASNAAQVVEVAMEELDFTADANSEIEDAYVVASGVTGGTLTIRTAGELSALKVLKNEYREELEVTKNAQGYSCPVTFTNGINTFYVTAVAADGKTRDVFRVHVICHPDRAVSVTGIRLNGEALKGFRPQQEAYLYQLPVGKNALTVAVEAVPADDVTIALNGAVITGNTAEFTRLQDGANTLTIRARAADGITAVHYTVTVVKPYDSNATLQSVRLDGKNVDLSESPVIMVSGETVTLTAAAQDNRAKVTVCRGDEVVAEAVGSVETTLTPYENDSTFTIHITSVDGKTTRTSAFTLVRGVYASDVDWTSATVGWGDGVHRDKNVNNTAITLADKDGKPVTFTKGLGAHAESVIRYNVAGKGYTAVRGFAGVDYCQYNAQYGSVQFQIFADNNRIFDSGVMVQKTPMAAIDAKIPAGTRELTFKALQGEHNWNDHADWADLKFLGSFGEKTTVDKNALAAAIENAQKKQETDYTADSWNTFTTALDKAVSVNKDPAATQTQVNGALAELSRAVEALRPRAEEGREAAAAVDAKIDAIGTVTLDSEQKITEARAAYEALTEAQKALVTKLDVLTAAEKKLDELKNPEKPVPTFPDVKPGDWFYNGVTYSAQKGFMSGLPDGTFGPKVTMTRAQLVQMLYAMEGKPDVALTNQFSDVNSGEWFAKAVSWAVESGVTGGVGGGEFAPNAKITRQEMAVMLYAYWGRPEAAGKPDFVDNVDIADWAAKAVVWAVDSGLMGSTSTEQMMFSPKNTATRAEAAIIMMNLDKL